jgi:hypothetical protein
MRPPTSEDGFPGFCVLPERMISLMAKIVNSRFAGSYVLNMLKIESYN